MSDRRSPEDADPPSPGEPVSEAELIARREALAARLAAKRSANPPSLEGPGASMRGAADGMKLASEFVAGVLAGAGIGYLLDRIAGTQPFGLIVFLLLGFVAGVLNVLRSIGRVPQPGPAPAAAPDPVAPTRSSRGVEKDGDAAD